eukprot:403353391
MINPSTLQVNYDQQLRPKTTLFKSRVGKFKNSIHSSLRDQLKNHTRIHSGRQTVITSTACASPNTQSSYRQNLNRSNYQSQKGQGGPIFSNSKTPSINASINYPSQRQINDYQTLEQHLQQVETSLEQNISIVPYYSKQFNSPTIFKLKYFKSQEASDPGPKIQKCSRYGLKNIQESATIQTQIQRSNGFEEQCLLITYRLKYKKQISQQTCSHQNQHQYTNQLIKNQFLNSNNNVNYARPVSDIQQNHELFQGLSHQPKNSAFSSSFGFMYQDDSLNSRERRNYFKLIDQQKKLEALDRRKRINKESLRKAYQEDQSISWRRIKFFYLTWKNFKIHQQVQRKKQRSITSLIQNEKNLKQLKFKGSLGQNNREIDFQSNLRFLKHQRQYSKKMRNQDKI